MTDLNFNRMTIREGITRENSFQEGKRMKTMKPGTRLNPRSSVGHWEGVLRDGSGRVVWACGHLHKCRDENSRIHGKAARRCAEEALRLLKTE